MMMTQLLTARKSKNEYLDFQNVLLLY